MSSPATRQAVLRVARKLGQSSLGCALLARSCTEVAAFTRPLSRSGVDLLHTLLFTVPRVPRPEGPLVVDLLTGPLFPGGTSAGVEQALQGLFELLELLLETLKERRPPGGAPPLLPPIPDGAGKKTNAAAFASWAQALGLDPRATDGLTPVCALLETTPPGAVTWQQGFSGELIIADPAFQKKLTREACGIFTALTALAAHGAAIDVDLTPPPPAPPSLDPKNAADRVPARLRPLTLDIVDQMARIDAENPTWTADISDYEIRVEWIDSGELRLIFHAGDRRSFGHVVGFQPGSAGLRVTYLRGSRGPGQQEPPWDAMARGGLGLYLDELCDPLSPLRATVLARVGYAKWEKLADALKQQAHEVAAAVGDDLRDEKLVWVLDNLGVPAENLDTQLDLAPYLTRRKKGRGWTKPQRKSVRQVLVLPRKVLTDTDRAVLEHLAEDRRTLGVPGRGTSVPALIRALRMLQHDGVDVVCRLKETEVGVALTLEETTAAVRLEPDPDSDGYVMELHADGHPLDVDAVLDWQELVVDLTHQDPPRLLVVAVPLPIKKVARTLREIDVAFVPPEGAPAVAEALVGLSAQKIQVELPPTLQGTEVAPDATVVVRAARLNPLGLVIRLGHQPLPDGPFLHPGEGAQSLLGEVNAERVQTHRDVDAERARLTEVAELLELSLDDAVGPWRYRLEDSDVALDVLARLHDLSVPHGERDPSLPAVRVEWGDFGPLRARTADSAAALQVRVEQPRDWFRAEGVLEVDEHKVALIKLVRQSREGKRWIEVDHNLFIKLTGQLRDQVHQLAALTHERQGHLEMGPHVAPLLDELEDAGAQLQDTEARRALRDRIRAAGERDLSLPPGVDRVLRPYQREGARWMLRLSHWGVGGCLADDMGLGKTLQTLAVLEARKAGGAQLVVAPTSVCANWEAECRRFTPSLTPILYEGPGREKLLEHLGPGHLLITSYALLATDDRLLDVGFHSAIYDEAQYLKNHATKRSQAARQLSTDWSLALTGTPVENHLGELWSIFHVVSPALLGSHKRFMLTFATPIERHKDAGRRRWLQRTVRPFLLRRLKAEVESELPSRTDVIVPVVLSADERAQYEAVRQELVERLSAPREDDTDRRFEVLAGLTRLRLVACHPQLEDPETTVHSSKLERIGATLEQLRAGGHRALVFSQFVKHLNKVEALLNSQGVRHFKLTGATPAGKRRELIDRFQRGEADVFLISLKAGGTGLNLTAATYVLHLDPWWNPAVEDQATDRAHRIGQEHPVTVFRFIAKGTIEEQILAMHEDKRALAEELVAGGGAKLSTEALVELLRTG